MRHYTFTLSYDNLDRVLIGIHIGDIVICDYLYPVNPYWFCRKEDRQLIYNRFPLTNRQIFDELFEYFYELGLQTKESYYRQGLGYIELDTENSEKLLMIAKLQGIKCKIVFDERLMK